MIFDFHELTRLKADIEREAHQIVSETGAVVKKGAMNVKTDWRSNAAASSGRHARLYPATIDFDMKSDLEAEIGPQKRGQGNLGHLLEYGTATSGPHDDGKRAADKEEPRFEKELEKLSDRLLR
jgi:hypothetical protein